MKRDIQWFNDHIGKEIYRKKFNEHDLYDTGRVKIADKQHARVLFLNSEEIGIQYFDTKEERDNYINNNKK